jgi:hypothetical protein
MKEVQLDYFETEFVNKRETAVEVQENGRVLLRLEPGQSKFVESSSAKTSYSPWYKIEFRDKGRVELYENKAWVWPYPDVLMLTALNEDGAASEGLQVDGKYWECYKGIPRYIPIAITSTWAFTSLVKCVEVEEKVKDGDYFKTVKELRWVKEARSRKETRDIERELVRAAVEKAKAETEARFTKNGPAEAADR